MPKQNRPDDSDKTLGAKVAHLIGLLGYRYSDSEISDNAIASFLSIEPYSWSRVKGREIGIGSLHLSRLSDLFRLHDNYGLTYEVFHCRTLGEFKERLAEHDVGLGGVRLGERTICLINKARNLRKSGIEIEVVRRRGVGFPPEGKQLVIGEFIRLSVNHPKDGHMLVFSVCSDGHFSRLMPSSFAPCAAVSGTKTELPAVDGRAPALEVYGPDGGYQFYAIWSVHPFERLDSILNWSAHRETDKLSTKQLRQLSAAVKALDVKRNGSRPKAPDHYAIYRADYHINAPRTGGRRPNSSSQRS